jgi:DNA mismatch repair ATPase MutS
MATGTSMDSAEHVITASVMQHQMPRAKPNDVHRLQASVVNRDMVAVVTRGTMTDAEMLSRHPDASFLLALAEAPAAPADSATGVQLPSPPCFRCMKYMFQ